MKFRKIVSLLLCTVMIAGLMTSYAAAEPDISVEIGQAVEDLFGIITEVSGTVWSEPETEEEPEEEPEEIPEEEPGYWEENSYTFRTESYAAPTFYGLPAAPQDGVVLDKTAVYNEDGTVSITLEAYTTGRVTSTAVATDICIVVDQSESMKENLGGTTKAAALQNSLHQFISNVAASGEHRIAIEGYADNQNYDKKYLHTGWVETDAAGTQSLHDAVDSMKFIGKNTDVLAGMAGKNAGKGGAYSLMDNSHAKNKIVILFTDGYPSTQESENVNNDFDINLSNSTIEYANQMKDLGVTIYTIGMFEGADPNELYGPGSDGSQYSQWSGSDKMAMYNPASNRFLNYVSSNVPYTVKNDRDIFVNLGLNYEGDVYAGGYHTFQIISYMPKEQNKYYLTAADSAELEGVFDKIVEDVAPAVSLKNAVVTDKMSPYFEIPNKKFADVRVSTAPYEGNDTFGAPTKSALKADVHPKAGKVVVEGFDFDDHMCYTDSTGNHGDKLIIEFKAKPIDGFLGGNGVPTNDSTSGLSATDYDKKFDVPAVDVPPVAVTPAVQDQSVYLMGTGDIKAALTDVDTYTVNGVSYTPDGVRNAFADLTYTFRVDGEEIGTYTIPKGQTTGSYAPYDTAAWERTAMTDDLLLRVSATTAVSEAGEDQVTGDAQDAHIYVFRPLISFQDSESTAVQDGDLYNYRNTRWTHGADDESIPAPAGRAPDLAFEYIGEHGEKDGVPTQDTRVSVEVWTRSSTKPLTEYVTFERSECPVLGTSCTFDDANGTYQFMIHIRNRSLTITKQAAVGTTFAPGESFLFRITGEGVDMTVVISGEGSVTIRDLPVGTYTVTEDTSWSWRYTANDAEQQVELTADMEVVFTNEQTQDTILTSEAYCKNEFEPLSAVMYS